MTTLDPSHNIFRESSGRHAQAVHRADDIPLDRPAASAPPDEDEEDESEMGIDDELGVDDRLPSSSAAAAARAADARAKRKGKMEARRRVRGAMPPMPDLRFEQVRSIL